MTCQSAAIAGATSPIVWVSSPSTIAMSAHSPITATWRPVIPPSAEAPVDPVDCDMLRFLIPGYLVCNPEAA